LRKRRLQRLQRSLIGKTFVEINNGIGITHQVLWVGQSRSEKSALKLASSHLTGLLCDGFRTTLLQ
jgi:hypothetical protein